MGTFYGKNENKIPEKNILASNPINKDIFIKNLKRRELNDPLDFSTEKLKIKAEKIYYEAIKLDNEEEKYLKLKEAISYDNTNDAILRDYLKIARIQNKEAYSNEINLYYYHISPESYKDITGQKKDKSSIDLFVEIFSILKNYNIENKSIQEEFDEKYKVFSYFFHNESFAHLQKANSNFTLKSNFELSLYDIYFLLFHQIQKKIFDLRRIATNKNLNIDQKLFRICQERHCDNIKMIIKNYNNIDPELIILYKSNFFSLTLLYIKDYVLDLDDVITKCLKFNNLETDYYVLLFIVLEIKYIVTHRLTPFYTDKIKEYINNNLTNDSSFNNYISQIKDINKYNKTEIIDYLKTKKSFEEFNEYILNKFIKIEFFNSHNIMTSMMKFVNKFNEKISNSRTIVTMLNQLYPELSTYKLFESQFTKNLFKNAIDNCYFFPFNENKASMTLENSTKILFFVSNKANIIEENLDYYLNKLKYLIGNLGIFIYNELHEVLGNYLRLTLSKITEYNYTSPIEPNSNNNEDGECIDFLLFGKNDSFNMKQILYFLDVNNYDKTYEKFREDFDNIEAQSLNISKEFLEMLKEVNINLDLDLINKIGDEFFKENYILNDSLIQMPVLNDCVEKMELIRDEEIINFIKNINSNL